MCTSIRGVVQCYDVIYWLCMCLCLLCRSYRIMFSMPCVNMPQNALMNSCKGVALVSCGTVLPIGVTHVMSRWRIPWQGRSSRFTHRLITANTCVRVGMCCDLQETELCAGRNTCLAEPLDCCLCCRATTATAQAQMQI